ncbi:Tripartite motif-containing protein 39 [Chelonia mydas]|uniref:Tripartite motif-containing protein 39 n=1 Tax=Chelonia mydas TaxID=8469 RepID=M7BW77_CHEMY|nr:Tripartite motif-containing protein 39 [Chelonia mydas]
MGDLRQGDPATLSQDLFETLPRSSQSPADEQAGAQEGTSGLGSGPHISVADYEAGGIRVVCTSVDVTLDPATAQSNLILSEDRKSVRHGDTRQDLPDNPERFEPYVIVLGMEGFTGGRHYWEVEVGKKPEWTLGVCRDSVRRKGSISVTSESGYFVVCLRDGEKYWARTSPLTRLPVSVRPRQVGVFLDYEAGEVSFYNVTDQSHLFTFTGTFSGMLRPYFSPCLNEGGKNADPLIIRPVPAPAGGNLGPCQ